jgi:hypothetical protein
MNFTVDVRSTGMCCMFKLERENFREPVLCTVFREEPCLDLASDVNEATFYQPFPFQTFIGFAAILCIFS